MNELTSSQHYPLYNELSKLLADLEKGKFDILERAEACIKLSCSYVELLRTKVKEQGFKDKQAEIIFFKFIKPHFACLYIYHVSLFHFHRNMPEGTFSIINDYVAEEFNRITRFFEENNEFYRYYQSKYEFNDEKYFLRGKPDFQLYADSLLVQSDPEFTTSHDYLCSQILANKRMLEYLKQYIGEIDRPRHLTYTEVEGEMPKLTWTESDAALTELIYALYRSGAINNGNANIKDITAAFRKVFNWNPGNIYDTFQHVKSRKNNPAKFLQRLVEILMRKLDEGLE